MEPFQDMSRRQFMWGLFDGVMILAMVGLGWLVIGVFTSGARLPAIAWSLPSAGTAVLVIASRRLRRRKSGGFSLSTLKSELKSSGPVRTQQAQSLRRQFLWV